ncbi:MAG: V-type ATPase subunit [Gammaproteobacteria bacterium]
MSQARDSAYLNTRVAILGGKLLDREQLSDLVALDFDQVVARLTGGQLGQLDTSGEEDRARVLDALDHHLIQDWVQDLLVLLRPLRGKQRDVLVQWSRRMELFNIKAMVRGKLAGHSAAEIEAHLHDLPGSLSLARDELLRTESVTEFMRLLEQTPYASIARHARRNFEERSDPFRLDASLDRWFYVGLMGQLLAMEEPDRGELRRLIGTSVDRHNLTWLLRYRFVYGLSATETYYLLIPNGLRLHTDDLRRLVDMDRFEQVLEELPEPLRGVLEGSAHNTEVEQRMQAHLSAIAHGVLRRSPSVAARVFAYLMLRFLDTRTVFAILEGKRLGLDETLIGQAVGLKPIRVPEAA